MSIGKKHTFVICAHQESPFLENCIRSLLRQTVNDRIIIVTSTPNTYIRDASRRHGLDLYINEGKSGITQDWNYGYSCADTRYVTIAHQDDIYEKRYLETAMNYLDHSQKPLIFFSDYYEIRSGKKIDSNRLLQIKRLMLIPLRPGFFRGSKWIRRRILSLGNPICCPSVTFCKENLPPVVFRNHFRACEDWEAWEMLSRRDGDFLYSPRRLMGHRIHSDSETSSSIRDHVRSKEEYEMYCKFWPGFIAMKMSRLYSKGQESNQL